jgi:predicted RND superfamily exporter protein
MYNDEVGEEEIMNHLENIVKIVKDSKGFVKSIQKTNNYQTIERKWWVKVGKLYLKGALVILFNILNNLKCLQNPSYYNDVVINNLYTQLC